MKPRRSGMAEQNKSGFEYVGVIKSALCFFLDLSPALQFSAKMPSALFIRRLEFTVLWREP